MRGRLQCYMWMGWMDGMVIIGHRSSKSIIGANNYFLFGYTSSKSVCVLYSR